MPQSHPRRQFLKSLALGVASFFMPSFGCSTPSARTSRPNVLFIVIDDLNDWVGVLGGHPQARTPHIDALAARGVVFTNAHCAAPACGPSRAATLTGIRPSTSGIYGNENKLRSALPEVLTLPAHLRAHGYRARGAGKIFHGPDARSWDEYFPSFGTHKPRDPRPPNRPLNGIPAVGAFDWGPIDVPDAEMGDALVASWVADQLAVRGPEPFFLGCGLFRPHIPLFVPRRYFDLYPLDEIVLPETQTGDLSDIPFHGRFLATSTDLHRKVVTHDQWHAGVRGYLASLSFADAQLGRVLDALDAGPHAADTIVVLWSDHGWHLGEKEHWEKFALWEEATRVPLIIVAPGVTRPGGRCAEPVNLIDLFPTLAELCGVPLPPQLEGSSLVPQLIDPSARRDRPSVTTYRRNNHAIRDERWRYIRYHDGTEELYDHRSDANEWHNLADREEYAAVIERLAQWLPGPGAEPGPIEFPARDKAGGDG